MATITQRLAFLISANAEQAIKAFDKTANSAEKQMRKAGNSIDKVGVQLTKFGAAGLAAAGTLGTGLFKLAQGAIEDQKSQALLAEQLRKTTGATDSQIKKVEELIDSTARATGFTDDQLRPAFASLTRTFGDTDKAARVMATALDLSRATGRDLEAVTLALGRAATGNTGALGRMGIVLDDTTKKSKDFDQILAAVNARVGGQAAAFADTYAGKLERAKVAIGEAGESLGTAFVPFIEKASTALSTTINALGQFNEKTGGAVGSLAAFGTVGLGAISTMSLITGQVIKLRDRFGEVDAETGKFTGSLTTLGKVAVGGAAIIGAAAAVYAIYSSKKAEAEERTRKFADALALEGDEQTKALGSLAAADPKIRNYINTLNLLGLSTADVTKETQGGTTAFDGLRRQLEIFKARAGTGQVAADAFAKAIGFQGELTVAQVFEINKLVQQIDSMTGANKASKAAQDAVNQAMGEGADEADNLAGSYRRLNSLFETNYKWNEMRNRQVDRAAGLAEYQAMLEERAAATAGANDERRAKAAEAYAKQVDRLATKLQEKLSTALSNAEQNAANANAAYKAYFDAIKGSVTGVVSLGDAQATAAANTQALADAKLAEAAAQENLNKILSDPKADAEKVAEARQSLADATKAVTAAEQAPLTFADALSAQVAKANLFKNNLQQVLDLGGDKTLVAQLAAAGADAGNAIIGGLLAATDPKAAVAALGQTVANVDALGSLIGKASANQFYGEGVSLANELLRGVSEQLAGIDLEKIKGGRNAVKNLKKLDKSLKNTPVDTSLGLILGAQVPALADGGIVKASPGGTLALLGEGGRDEMVMPLPAKQSQPTVVNITVNAGLVSSPQQVGQQIIDAILRAQRVNGAVFVTV